MATDNPATSPTVRDEERLLGVHPRLVQAIRSILAQMYALGHPMFVVEGVRSDARQATLYAIGRTQPGTLVTYRDGRTSRSNHQVHPDGYGYAVDCAFVSSEPYADRHPWREYGSLVESFGLTWGGTWRMYDAPHAELTDTSHVAPSTVERKA